MLKIYLPYIVTWAALTAVVVFLAIYRRRIDSRVDENLHVLDSDAPAVSTQEDVAKKLAIIDRWGKVLTVISVLYLLGIVAAYIYGSFNDTSIRLG
jgi:hypothetical protein